jgi:NADH:ubiquinone oxidoreductase subunit B-like Fe-S oxidoreductase
MIKEESPFIKELQKSGGAAIRTIHDDMQESRSVVAGGDCSAASGKCNYRNI